MLVLLLADTGSTKSLGPVSAIGVALVLIAGLTLLPALLTIAGRRGFWPRRRTVAYQPEVDLVDRPGLWRRFGTRVLQRPGMALGATVALFALFTLGLFSYKEDYSIGGFFKKDVESVDGFDVLGQSFPQGALAPTTVLVRRDGGPATDADIAAARERVEGIRGVAAVGPPQRSKDEQIGRFDFTFPDDPYSEQALARVETVRDRLANLPGGAEALVGSGSAVQEDFNQAAARDTRVIVPVTLALILIILAVLLRALVMPLYVVATVLLSFAFALGASALIFTHLLDQPASDPSLPLFAFVFLVALGVDYNVFLLARIREERAHQGTEGAVTAALARTGGVITSAGLVLAVTFGVLMALPIEALFQVGFVVSLGVLADTFLVRALLVPAIAILLGERNWWPSRSSKKLVLRK
jgi:RND superfamily putative drug exporter